MAAPLATNYGARVLLVDASAYDPLRLTWRVGHLIKSPHRFTHRLYVHSWDEAMERLCAVGEQEKLSEVQFWGHGAPGRVLIGHYVLNANYLRSSALLQRWVAMEPFQLSPSPLVWFRTCETMRGDVGRAFAEQLSRLLRCRVAGYTQYIHVLQRGLVVVSPGGDACWSDEATAGDSVWFYTFSPSALESHLATAPALRNFEALLTTYSVVPCGMRSEPCESCF